MTNGTLWTDGVPSNETTNEAEVVNACVAISCHAIFTVPGEIYDPAFGAYEVWYTENVLHFHPDYWEIGNEPYDWVHWGKPWAAWNYTDNIPSPNSTQYALEVNAYISAMKAVDSSIQFIGLPGVGHGWRPDWAWINPIVRYNGPNLSALAIHAYPGQNNFGNNNLSAFFASLTSRTPTMTKRVTEDQLAIANETANISCGTCSIKLLVDEFGAGTRLSVWQPFMHTYAQVPYVAAELVMMSQANVSNADLFELRSNYNGSLFNGSGLPFPLDSLYTGILPHYDLTPLHTSVSGLARGVFAGVTESASSNSLTLLAVNTNVNQSVQLNVAGSVFPTDGSYVVWRESNSTALPNGAVSQSFGFQSSPSWVVPPLGVILVSACRANGSLGSGGCTE